MRKRQEERDGLKAVSQMYDQAARYQRMNKVEIEQSGKTSQ